MNIINQKILVIDLSRNLSENAVRKQLNVLRVILKLETSGCCEALQLG